ncbi:ribose-5-phosphate isomerase [Frankia sp. CcI156]|uniref:Ribose-5-phosphate isomerase B n=1 Tax=Frankia casuarinae (strain DSM 45818 / CECT 9043 / HFP020203 / CcI3) TaxID=106370 RepID=Q2JDV1_FRACC|nr:MULTISPECIES: ribose-5-phosphate isomerase [Frankia]ABD10541.1 ribose 5-phosphate isomerase [Frankia casuarinae]ETA03122.1 ribose 5-phosphate isomerase RpiB [Frankia sp. CcI6]EYT92038.1 ribose 5-phosphate isomerase RpiB [Frankia casuarinae]KDA42949.1 ribose 5-phosphate isomerase RpiB [Frankia sp. BMG5.23]KEZ36538.1 ribose 5-phosphate isomerase [Frankia sp. CeD]
MRVHLGSDHAGFHLKEALAERLVELGHAPVDHGPVEYDPDDDYPPFVLAAAAATAVEPGSMGIVIGGSGNGEAIAANKVAGVRAALAWSEQTATLARQHNDANVLSLGARMYTVTAALTFAEVFLTTPFSGEQRHVRRLRMLSAYERTGDVPSVPGSASSAS